MLSYSAALKILEGRTNFEKEMPAKRSAFKHAVMQFFMQQHPQLAKLKIIHIAGTKGKGSTAAMIHGLLRHSGYSCGLYTSPHLVQWRERIRVNDKDIAKSAFCKHMSHLEELAFPDQPTYFEYLTMIALLEFADKGLDFVVLETGLGGRLDTTNVVSPCVCALTRISKDHCAILGNTVTAIAAEKAGIIKKRIPVISGSQHWRAKEVIVNTAQKQRAPLRFAPSHSWAPLAGEHQRQNFGIALAVLDELRAQGFSFKENHDGLSINWPGRFQYLQKQPPLVIDGAHNPDSTRVMIATWQTEIGTPIELIFGSTADKDWQSSLRLLQPHIRRATFVPITSNRSVDPKELQNFARSLGITASIGTIDQLKKITRPTLCCGSLYLVGEILGNSNHYK